MKARALASISLIPPIPTRIRFLFRTSIRLILQLCQGSFYRMFLLVWLKHILHQFKTFGSRRNLYGNGKSSARRGDRLRLAALAATAHSRFWHIAAPDVCDGTSAVGDAAFQAHPLVNRVNLASRIAQRDQRTALPGPMSALGGSGRAVPKEEVRI